MLASGLLLVVGLAAVPATTARADYPGPVAVTGDTAVHDPDVTRTPAGGYLLVHTGPGLTIKTSADRTAWRNAGRVFPNGAPWTDTYRGGNPNLWAPDISYVNGRYYLYYAASSFASNRSAIFLATSSTGATGSWSNQGLVVESRTSDDYNTIDPNLNTDGGRWTLTFGSFWSGIRQIDIDGATGLRSGSALRATAGRDGGPIEAPFVVKHGSYFYQYVSFDYCCRGAASTYRIMVGRSSAVTGPYRDRSGVDLNSGGGTEILAGHGSVHGPGQASILADPNADVIFYHYYANSGTAYLGINLLGYDSSAWPYVY